MSQTVRIIDIPIGLGQNHRGIVKGPFANRYAERAKTYIKPG